MANFEKYKNELLRVIGGIALKNGKIVSCETLRCEDCDFYNDGNDDCDILFANWLYEDDSEKQGGCIGCKYEYKREDGSPCTECCNNYMSKWERKPKKTRQDEFLEHYPDAKRDVSGVLAITPCSLGERKHKYCEDRTCWECKSDYWLQEEEE